MRANDADTYGEERFISTRYIAFQCILIVAACVLGSYLLSWKELFVILSMSLLIALPRILRQIKAWRSGERWHRFSLSDSHLCIRDSSGFCVEYDLNANYQIKHLKKLGMNLMLITGEAFAIYSLNKLAKEEVEELMAAISTFSREVPLGP